MDADEGAVCQKAEALPEPIVPTRAEVEAHNVTHLPYRSWCKWCVMARRRNTAHSFRPNSSRRSMPHLVADHCHMRDYNDVKRATTLVAKMYPAKAIRSVAVDPKGLSALAIDRMSRFIKETRYLRIAYKSGQEVSIRAVLEESIKQAGRQGVEQATPESSAVGQSQSNGRAENTVGQLEDLVRTYNAALEDRIGERIPSTHPITSWLVGHAASVHHRYVVGDDGRTPYEAMHGQRFRGNLAEFGGQVFYYIPKKLRSKLDLRWRISNGDVVQPRAVARVAATSRWRAECVLNVKGTPSRLRPQNPDETDLLVEEISGPHRGGDDLPVDRDGDRGQAQGGEYGKPRGNPEIGKVDAKKLDSQIKITLKDLQQFGFTDGCPRCNDIIQNRKWKRNHGTECQLGIYLDHQKTANPKWSAVKPLCDADKAGPNLSQGQVDVESAAATQKAEHGKIILGNRDPNATPRHPGIDEPNSARMDLEADYQEMQENTDAAFNDNRDVSMQLDKDEGDVATLFAEFEDDDQGMGQDDMVESLKLAGVREFKASTPATFMEVCGRSIFHQSQVERRNINVKRLGAFDLCTTKNDGQPWNICLRSDRKEARALINKLQPEWIIGAPPCTVCSIWNHGMNFKKVEPEKIQKLVQEGLLHLKFMCSLYKRQLVNGKYFLHENTASAVSWREDDVRKIASHPLVRTTVADQCMYGLLTPSDIDKSVLVPAMKPTRFMTNSQTMAHQLSTRCNREHAHQHLTGGRYRDAAFYPAPLVRAILRGMAIRKDSDTKKITAPSDDIFPINALPIRSTHSQQHEFGEPTMSKIPKMSGGQIPVVFKEGNFKRRYTDEYTGDKLPTPLIRAAIGNELVYFNDRVWELASKEEIEVVPDYILFHCRWVLCNTGDSTSPDVRARLGDGGP